MSFVPPFLRCIHPIVWRGVRRENLAGASSAYFGTASTNDITVDQILITPENLVVGNINKDGTARKFASTWLRFNCSCPSCRQPSSGQRLLNAASLPKSLTLRSVDLKEEYLEVYWNEDGHQGKIRRSDLVDAVSYCELKPKVYAKKGDLPTFRYFDLLSKQSDVHRMFIKVLEDGFALIRGVPCESGMVKQFIESVMRLPVQRTIYGEIFDVISTPNPINVAYSNAELKPHIDLAYYESPPGLQLLHCLRYDKGVQGGDSVLVDSFGVAEEMRRRYPDEFSVLTKIPATFQKIHFERDWPVYMRYRRPHISLNDENQVTAVFWAPQFEGPLIPPENAEKYHPAYRKFSELLEEEEFLLKFRLDPGDLIVFNNRRMLHGRDAFSLADGVRHLQGAYVNIDEFKSQAQVMLSKSGKSVNVPRVANQSF